MVKRIKKRVPKKTEEVVEEGTEVEVEGSVVDETAATNEADPVQQGDALRFRNRRKMRKDLQLTVLVNSWKASCSV